MKKFRTFLCLMISAVMLFALTACGDNTFEGNFKTEATTEEIKTVMADISKSAEGGALDSEKVGLKIVTDQELTTTYNDKSMTLKSKAESTTQVVDKKVQIAAKGTIGNGEKEYKVEEYLNADGLYIDIDGNKGMISAKSEEGKYLIEAVDDMAEMLADTDTIMSQLQVLFAVQPEEFEKAGIKVYIDSSKKATKIKYEVSADALKGLYGDEESGIKVDMKKYELYIVLDADKKLTGVKADVDMSVAFSAKNSIATKVTSSIEVNDKEIKFPNFKDYKELKEEKELEDFFKPFIELMGSVADGMM